jgi:hypothetical protein
MTERLRPESHWDLPWDAVMAPLAESSLWPYIRNAASDILAHRMAGTGCGISSSDVNHTVFGVAKFVYLDDSTPSGDRSYASAVLRALVNEAAGC